MSFSGQWKGYGCCLKDSDDLPAPVQNLLIFEMFGYNYRTLPEWFDKMGHRMMPLQFSLDSDNMYYRWSFYKPVGNLCKSGDVSGDPNIWHISTSDDIVPIVHSKTDGKRQEMKVERLTKHNGYTTWLVYC